MFLKYTCVSFDANDRIVKSTEIAEVKAICRSNDYNNNVMIVLADDMTDLILGINTVDNAEEYNSLVDAFYNGLICDKPCMELTGICMEDAFDFDDEDAEKKSNRLLDTIIGQCYALL